MTLRSYIGTEPVEITSKRSWTSWYDISQQVDGTKRWCEYVPSPGLEARLVCSRVGGGADATVANRYYRAELDYNDGRPISGPHCVFRSYYNTFITAGQGFDMSHVPGASGEHYLVTAQPFVGQVHPIPDVWIDDQFVWRFVLGDSPAASTDSIFGVVTVEERYK